MIDMMSRGQTMCSLSQPEGRKQAVTSSQLDGCQFPPIAELLSPVLFLTMKGGVFFVFIKRNEPGRLISHADIVFFPVTL